MLPHLEPKTRDFIRQFTKPCRHGEVVGYSAKSLVARDDYFLGSFHGTPPVTRICRIFESFRPGVET